MKVIIAGGRDFANGHSVVNAVKEFEKENGKITEIVCGMCRGADMMGLNYGKFWDIPVKEFPADWKTYGNSAGYKRNIQMANYGEALIAFWDGKSRGTKSMIEIATGVGLKVYIVKY